MGVPLDTRTQHFINIVPLFDRTDELAQRTPSPTGPHAPRCMKAMQDSAFRVRGLFIALDQRGKGCPGLTVVPAPFFAVGAELRRLPKLSSRTAWVTPSTGEWLDGLARKGKARGSSSTLGGTGAGAVVFTDPPPSACVSAELSADRVIVAEQERQVGRLQTSCSIQPPPL